MLEVIKVKNPEFKTGDWVYDFAGSTWYQLQEMDITSGMVYIPDKIFTGEGKIKDEDVFPTLFHISHPIIKHVGIKKPKRTVKLWIGIKGENENSMIELFSEGSESKSQLEDLSKQYNLNLNLQEVSVVLE